MHSPEAGISDYVHKRVEDTATVPQQTVILDWGILAYRKSAGHGCRSLALPDRYRITRTRL